MNFKAIKYWFSSGEFLFNRTFALVLWFGLSLATIIQNLLLHSASHSKFNNYTIFKTSFFHILQHQNLYLQYPNEYADVFLYGPTFTVLIAPFAMLPDWLGVSLWVVFNVSILYFAITKLPIKKEYQYAILILSAHEMMNAASWVQTNALVAACLILGYVYISKSKDFIGLAFITFATITKVYGIVGFSFFFFSNNKLKFIGSTIFWFLMWYLLPLCITSFSNLNQCYKDWYAALTYKSNKNVRLDINNFFQDISVMGLIRRNISSTFNKDNIVLLFAAIGFCLQYTQYKYFKDIRYQLYFLCSVLIFTVIFSTSAESPTYIIAFPACCLWFVLQPSSKKVNAFFVFCLLVVSFSYSDIFTKYTREFSMQHSLKALPCFMLWLVILYQILTRQFLKIDINNGLKIPARNKNAQ